MIALPAGEPPAEEAATVEDEQPPPHGQLLEAAAVDPAADVALAGAPALEVPELGLEAVAADEAALREGDELEAEPEPEELEEGGQLVQGGVEAAEDVDSKSSDDEEEEAQEVQAESRHEQATAAKRLERLQELYGR